MYNSENSRAFQKELDVDKHRRNRQNARSILRKQNRETQFRQKRQAIRDTKGIVITNQSSSNSNNNNNNNQPQQQSTKIDAKLELLPQYVQGCIQSNHPGTQFECVQKIRQLLSVEGNALQLIAEVIHSGVVPRLVQFLRYDKYDRLQFESAWALTNIASGDAEHTAEVIKNSAIPLFVELVSSTNSIQVIEQAIWALGNIAGDSKECRNLVLDNHALSNIWQLLNSKMISDMNTYYMQTYHIMDNDEVQTTNQHTLSLMRNITWTIGNFVRGKISPEWQYIEIAIKSLVLILHMKIVSNDLEITRDACWAFSYLSDIEINPNIFPLLLGTGALEKVIWFLGNFNADAVRHPALRCVGNIVTGNDDYTQECINLGVLPQLLKLLNISDTNQLIKKEACWAVSNITAGNERQIDDVINANLIPTLVRMLYECPFDIRKEAAWALCNITSGGTDLQIRYLVHVNILQPLCRLFHHIILKVFDHRVYKILLVLMEALHNILFVGERMRISEIKKYRLSNPSTSENVDILFPNIYADEVEDAGGLQALEDIQTHDQLPDNLFEKAQKILGTFFSGEISDDEDDENLPISNLVGFGDNQQQSGTINPFGNNSGSGNGNNDGGQLPVINIGENGWPSFNNSGNGGSGDGNINTNQTTNGMQFNF